MFDVKSRYFKPLFAALLLAACGQSACSASANDSDSALGELSSELRARPTTSLPANCSHKTYSSAFQAALTARLDCYRVCGTERAQCDEQLNTALRNACATQRTAQLRKTCLRAASGLYTQVLVGAESLFEQTQHHICPTPLNACSPHDINTDTAVPTLITATTCSDVYLSDICPVAEYNVNGCVTFDTTYWEEGVEVGGVIYSKALSIHPPDVTLDPVTEAFISDCRFFESSSIPPGIARVMWDVAQFDQFSAELALASANGIAPEGGAAIFRVYLDDELAFESDLIMYDTPLVPVALEFRNKKSLVLEVDSASFNYADHAVWLNARARRSCASN